MVRGFEWNAVLSEVAKRVPSLQFNSWIEPVEFVDVTDRLLLLKAPTTFSCDWIQDHYCSTFQGVVRDLYGMNVDLRVQLDENAMLGEDKPAPASDRCGRLESFAEPEPEPESVTAADVTRLPVASQAPDLFARRAPGPDPRYTFETFVVGPSNQFAAAAAQAVAERPGALYNPLFLHGPVGVGKTHLINAIANRFKQFNPKAKICLTSAEDFGNRLIESIQAGKMAEFRKKYRDSFDVLLVDDIHFFAGKVRTQEEFFHTFNAFYSSGRQVVFVSDRMPKEIEGLEDRLRSRFACGLTADIQIPEIETRIEILRVKAERDDVFLPADVAMFLASNIKSNIRILEGALSRLGAQASLLGAEVSLELAKRLFPEFGREAHDSVSADAIIDAACQHFSIKPAELKGKGRGKIVALSRQIVMYLLRKYCKKSFVEIGDLLGGKDHSTILYGVEKITVAIEQNAEIRQHVEAIQAIL